MNPQIWILKMTLYIIGYLIYLDRISIRWGLDIRTKGVVVLVALLYG